MKNQWPRADTNGIQFTTLPLALIFKVVNVKDNEAFRKEKSIKRTANSEINLIWEKATEDHMSFDRRKKDVQTLIVEMFLRLKKRGRPNQNEDEEKYAA